MASRTHARKYRRLARWQGAYYLLTGVWPLVSARTFQWVTGPKKDVWLVKTVGALVAAQGAALLAAARARERPSVSTAAIALGSAVGLAGIDALYAGARHRISRIYLLDAVAEVALAAGWARWLRAARGVKVSA